jgi:hypothetical protein
VQNNNSKSSPVSKQTLALNLKGEIKIKWMVELMKKKPSPETGLDKFD